MANIMITSGTSFEGYEITEYGPYKFVHTILSSNFLKEIGASIADIATDRSSMYHDKLDGTMKETIKSFEEVVGKTNYNAVVGFKTNIVDYSSNISAVIVSGTLVSVKKEYKSEFDKSDFVRKELYVNNYYDKLVPRAVKVILASEGNGTKISAWYNNYNMDDDSISASTDVGIAVNDNCKNKEKLLPFIKYCLSCDVQKNMSEECMYLPVNSDAMEKCIDSIDEVIDFEDIIVSDKEKAIVETAESAAIRDYKYIINNITKCNLYSFNCLSDTYFNSSVISDIVDKYLNGDISNEKFIRQLTAATEIYLKE